MDLPSTTLTDPAMKARLMVVAVLLVATLLGLVIFSAHLDHRIDPFVDYRSVPAGQAAIEREVVEAELADHGRVDASVARRIGSRFLEAKQTDFFDAEQTAVQHPELGGEQADHSTSNGSRRQVLSSGPDAGPAREASPTSSPTVAKDRCVVPSMGLGVGHSLCPGGLGHDPD